MRLFLQKISTVAIAVTGIMISVFIGFSIYGNSVGSFVIGVEESARLSLTLSEDGSFSGTSATSVLSAEGLKYATNTTYGVIPTNIEEGYGAKNDPERRRFTAYSFYLKNTSPVAVSYAMTIKITALHKAVDEAIRIMVIKDGQTNIYAKPKPGGEPEAHLDISVPYITTAFLSSIMVCNVDTLVFNTEQVVKYTIVMWLEGWDEECVDDIKGGAIKLSMQFSAR